MIGTCENRARKTNSAQGTERGGRAPDNQMHRPEVTILAQLESAERAISRWHRQRLGNSCVFL
jgi:hypothetical protein